MIIMIQKTIHHVWPGEDAFRPELHRFRRSWMQHHPDWSFRFWRTELGDGASDEVRALLADPRYSVVVKSDVARFVVLRLHGGVYVDSDMECLRPFDELLGDAFFCGRESEGVLCPSLVGCVPGHPVSERMVRVALDRIRELGPEHVNARPNEVTGPLLLTELARDRGDVRVYPESYFYPIPWWETHRLQEPTPHAYAKHWWNGATSPEGWTHDPWAGGRERAPETPRAGPLKYDLGGVWPRPGYITVNLVPGVDRCCDITDLDRLHAADGEVDEVLLSHTLEHIPVTRYVKFLRDLHRKLRPGGAVVVVHTDADRVIRDYVAGRLSFRSMRSTLFTPEDRLRDNPLNAHQNMWGAEELARDFRAVGFDAAVFDAGTWSFDMWEPLYPGDLACDHGKPIWNLGVRATKR
jgi:predicted SAM-dependent methyltransferase